MKKPSSYLIFALGSAAILLTAAAALRLFWRRPLAASLLGAGLLAAGMLALLWRRLPPLLCPYRTAERQLAALLRRSPRASLLYYDAPEEDAGPSLLLSADVERREGLQVLLLSLPAGHPDLPLLLSLPPAADLTAVFIISPSQSLQLTGEFTLLSRDESRRFLRLRPHTLRLPGRAKPLPVPAPHSKQPLSGAPG